MKRINSLIFILSFTMILTGCWDSAEINDREYVFAVGIDKIDDVLNFTAEVPKINEGSEQQHSVYTEESENFSKFFNERFLKTEKVISDRLMQVIVIGESTIKDSDAVKKIFDEIQRSPQINRRVKIAVSKGDAKDIINTEIPNNPVVGRFLSDMLVKTKRESYQDIFTFDEAILNLGEYGSAIIPLVVTEDDSLKIEGSAIVKDYKLAGYLNNDENEIVMLLLDSSNSKLSNMIIDVDGSSLSLDAASVSMTKETNLQDNILTVDYYVTLYTYIESFTLENNSLQDQDFLEKVKQTAKEDISKRTDDTIVKLQKVYKTDVLRVKDNLYKYHKSDFDKIKENYDDIFENASINVHYNIKIKSVGLVK
jgi:Ger(x)C family germination protein